MVIIDKETGEAIYANAELTADGVIGADFIDAKTTPENAESINVPPPSPWRGRAWRWTGSEFEPTLSGAATITALRDAELISMYDSIDAAAGQARARYITVAPGQEATYVYKGIQAGEFKAAGYTGTVPAFVQAEANAVGCSTTDAADLILAQQAAWMTKGAQIEEVRRSWKLAIESSTDRQTDLADALAEIGGL